MRRRMVVGTLAAGLACLVVGAPTQAGAGPQIGPFGAQPRAAQAKIVPLSADVEVVRSGAKDVTTSRLYRDSQGRTRTESGTQVTISDPTTRTTLKLDTRSRTYKRSTSAPADTAKAAGPSQNQTLASAPRALGTAQVQGVQAVGSAYTVTIPAYKTRPAIKKEVTIWLSSQVQLPVVTRVVDSSGQAYSQTYTNIRAGVEPAASLFTLPTGYREARAGTSGATIQETCPLLNEPDPLILESFGPFLGSGVVNATTDPQIGCIFVADAWYFEYPLEGFRTVPLGLPFDQWFVYDNGGLLPFVPYVAFGDIAFAAASLEDATIKDSLIILTVFY